jgi:hypothetical protein
MKTFIKLLALMIALMMVVSVFAACGDKNKTPADDDNKPGDTTTPDETPDDPKDPGTTPEDPGKTPEDPGKTPEDPEDPEDPKDPVEEDTSFLYNPTVSGLEMGTDYAWGDDEMTLDFTGSNIIRVKVADLEEAVAATITAAGSDKFANRVLQLKGAATYALPGFTAAQSAALFTAGYTYTITIEYYGKGGAMSIVALNGDTTREIVAAEKFEAGVKTVTFDYVVAAGDTGIAFVLTGDDAEFYLGRVSFVLFTYGPTYSQLAAGYYFDWSTTEPDDGNNYGEWIQVKDLTDADAKAAILAYGKTENDYVSLNPDQALPMSSSHYVEGRKYTVEVTYYTKTADGQQWFLILDGTAGNHAIKSGMFSEKAKVATSSCVWEVNGGDHTATWYSRPADLIIIDLKLTLDTSYDPHYKREDVHETTKEELAGQYVFDFSEGNVPSASKHYVDVDELSAELQAVMTSANGFGATVMHVQQASFSFYDSINGTFAADTEYTITLRAYSATGNFGGFLLLPMNASQVQDGNHANPVATPVEGAPGVYDVSWTILAKETVAYASFYGSPATDFYIGSITVTAGTYVAPEPLPEEGTLKFEGDQVAELHPGTGFYGTWDASKGSQVVDTPDEVKAAMGDKIGDKAVKLEKATGGGFWVGMQDYKFDSRLDAEGEPRVSYKITIELYVESKTQDDYIIIFNGNTNEFIIGSDLQLGANTITFDYIAAAPTWNIGFHQGDFVGYVGDITIQTIHC